MSDLILEGERLESLMIDDLKILQHSKKYCFTSDSVLLANFVKLKSSDRVLEFCCGSGVISLLVQSKVKPKIMHLVEIQEYMADMCKRSVKINGLEDLIKVHNISVQKSDKVFEKASFDVIICNPPYKKITGSDVSVADEIAISKHEVLLPLSVLILNVEKMLKFGGSFYLVHEAERLSEIIILCKQHNMEVKTLQFVQNKITSNPKIVLIKAVKGGKPSVKILPSIILNGEFYKG